MIDTIIIIDGCTVKVIADGLAQSEDKNGNDVFTVSSAAGLKHVMDNNLLGSAGSGDQTLIFEKDAEIDMSEHAWTPISVDGYNGADIMTIEGNGAILTLDLCRHRLVHVAKLALCVDQHQIFA